MKNDRETPLSPERRKCHLSISLLDGTPYGVRGVAYTRRDPDLVRVTAARDHPAMQRGSSVCLAGLCLVAAALIGLGGAASAATKNPRVALLFRMYGDGTVRINGLYRFTCAEPMGIPCQAVHFFRRGSRVVIKVHPRTGWKLIKWSGACKGASNKCVLQLKAQKTTVTVRARPPRLAVINSNLTEVTPPPSVCYKCGSTVSYGIILVNRSQSEDARNVRIGLNFVGTNGKVVTSDSQVLPGGIPAGTKFYLGGEAGVEPLSPYVTNLTVAFLYHHSAPRSLVAPAVTNIRLSTNPVDGTVIVTGDVTNQATRELSSHAEISAVYYDGAGLIVGGANTDTSVALPPGGQTAFEIDSPSYFPFPISQVKVSVDPDYVRP
jgi:hypothetical protein